MGYSNLGVILRFKISGFSSLDASSSLTMDHLTRYEFEAKLRLGHDDFDDIFARVLQMDKQKAEIFDKLTGRGHLRKG